MKLSEVEKVGNQAHPLRHLPSLKRSPDPAAAGFFRCFAGLCAAGCSLAVVRPGPQALSLRPFSLRLLTSGFSVNSSI